MGNSFREASFGEILSKEEIVYTELPSISKDENGKLYWAQPWHVLPSGITLEQFIRKVIRNFINRDREADLQPK
jgi:hypothetical protein